MAIVGNVWTVSVVFKEGGVPTDPPGAVTLTITTPQGISTIETVGQPSGANIVHDGPGAYHRDILCLSPNAWFARWNFGPGDGSVPVDGGPGDGEAAAQVSWPVGRTFD